MAHRVQPDLAGKITGMLLEIDEVELVGLVQSRQALDARVNEAITVLQHASKGDSAAA